MSRTAQISILLIWERVRLSFNPQMLYVANQLGFVDTSIYQSNGLCYDFCKDEYAFAVVQYDGCWCSNYVPDTTMSTSSCNTPCPGFDPENCGGNGLYGYIQLFKQALGTQGASESSSTTLVSNDTFPTCSFVYSTLS